jgi:outer membrane lipoprotein SlyB
MKQVWQLAARVALAASACAAVVGLGACSTTSPDVIKPGDAQRLSQVDDAVVLNVRPVVVEGSQSGIGGATGAVIGGVSGSGVSGNNRGSAMGGVVGAVVGGVVGNAVERYGTREDALEILLQLANGQRRAVVQAKGSETFNPGDAVILVTTGGKVRVMLAPKVNVPQTPKGESAR